MGYAWTCWKQSNSEIVAANEIQLIIQCFSLKQFSKTLLALSYWWPHFNNDNDNDDNCWCFVFVMKQNIICDLIYYPNFHKMTLRCLSSQKKKKKNRINEAHQRQNVKFQFPCCSCLTANWRQFLVILMINHANTFNAYMVLLKLLHSLVKWIYLICHKMHSYLNGFWFFIRWERRKKRPWRKVK